jgi:outer membrane biosynthesis protein TonB
MRISYRIHFERLVFCLTGACALAGFAAFSRDERIERKDSKRNRRGIAPFMVPAGRMPLSVVPTTVNEPTDPAPGQTGDPLKGVETGQQPRPNFGPGTDLPPDPEQDPDRDKSPVVRGSRWIDYDTHELLEMISELEDERRWARLREGIWIAILVHLVLISAITWIPRYVFKVPPVIDPFEAINKRKDLSYLDLPPDALRNLQPKVTVKPVPQKPPRVDKKTLDALNKPTLPPLPPSEEPKVVPAPTQPPPPPPVQPAPQSQSQLEAPRPQAVPARPSFAMGSQNPADQLRDAMKGASQGPGYGVPPSGGGLSMHPGAGTGGVQVLSDMQGVDFNSWLLRWHRETERTWDPLIPDEVNPPLLKQGQVQIRFKVLPNGRIMEGSMMLEGRSGDTALDRAAWGALTGSNYPPLPREFHGPYLELRALFMYNLQPGR